MRALDLKQNNIVVSPNDLMRIELVLHCEKIFRVHQEKIFMPIHTLQILGRQAPPLG